MGLGTLGLFVVLLFRSMIEIISKALSLTLYPPLPFKCPVVPLCHFLLLFAFFSSLLSQTRSFMDLELLFLVFCKNPYLSTGILFASLNLKLNFLNSLFFNYTLFYNPFISLWLILPGTSRNRKVKSIRIGTMVELDPSLKQTTVNHACLQRHTCTHYLH